MDVRGISTENSILGLGKIALEELKVSAAVGSKTYAMFFVCGKRIFKFFKFTFIVKVVKVQILKKVILSSMF